MRHFFLAIGFIGLILTACNPSKGSQTPKEILQEFQRKVANSESIEYAVEVSHQSGLQEKYYEKLLNFNKKQGIVCTDIQGKTLQIYIDGKEYRADPKMLLPLIVSNLNLLVSDLLISPSKLSTVTANKDTILITQYANSQKIVFNSEFLPVYYKDELNSVYHIHYESINTLSREKIDGYLAYIEQQKQAKEPREDTISHYDFGIYLSAVGPNEKEYAGLIEDDANNNEWTLIDVETQGLIHVTRAEWPQELDGFQIETSFPKLIFDEQVQEDFSGFAIGGYLDPDGISFLPLEEFFPHPTLVEATFSETEYSNYIDEEAEDTTGRQIHPMNSQMFSWDGYTYKIVRYNESLEDDYAYNLIGYCSQTKQVVCLADYCVGKTYPFVLEDELFLYVTYTSCGEGAWSEHDIYKLDKGRFIKIVAQTLVFD